MSNEAFDPVWLSYGRCCLREGFFDTLCDTFVAKSKGTARALHRPDTHQLKRTSETMLAFLMMFHRNESLATLGLLQVARTHGAGGDGVVPPHLYPVWVDSLVEAVRQHDQRFSHELGEAWRKAMERGGKHMTTVTF
jgi:hypothetical protein